MDTYTCHNVILHVDGDAFFASCEQATNPALRNKPIVIGYERGAATAFSYEAKKMGISRGVTIKEIKRDFPEAILVSSNYKKYSLYSARMKSIIMELTNKVEKTSIDECYVDITGLDTKLGMSYHTIIDTLQERLSTALGITFSIGVGPTKTLAKMGSSRNKPHGVTILSRDYMQSTLYNLPISYVPGIGFKTTPKMNALGVTTIRDFVMKDESWVKQNFNKPYCNLHQELQGRRVLDLETNNQAPKSISKTHAFKTPTANKEFLLSELSRHCEVVARKLRAHDLCATSVSCGIKNFDALYTSQSYRYDQPTDNPQDLFRVVSDLLPTIVRPGKKYRATQVSITGLCETGKQTSLFLFDQEKTEDKDKVLEVIDNLEQEYGVGAIQLGSSGVNTRDYIVQNATPLISDKYRNKVLVYPSLGVCE